MQQKYRLARLGRIVVQAVVAVALTAAVASGYSTFLTRMQLVPALLSCSAAWLVLWAAVTLLAGRVYCSSACPLGTLQDVFTAASRRRRRGFFYSAPATRLRWLLTVAVLVGGVLGLAVVVSLFDPYAAYARIVTCLAVPAVRAVAFSAAGALVAAVTLGAVAAVAQLRGRLLCNTVCPVGTLLGAVSRYSLYHVDINTDLCTGCNLCVKRCKASCINPADHTVDLSRCVVCFDCTAACPSDAITFRRGRHQLKMPLLRPTVSSAASPMSGPQAASSATRPLSRREFLASLTAAGCVSVMASAPEEALAPVNYPVPPGAVPDGAFEARCTGCGACVAACPTGAVHPATDELGWRNALHPYLDFNSGPCRYDCTACTHVCPSGAIEPLTAGAKHRFVIGKARVDARLCLMYEFGSSCGLCARRCPVQAVAIVTEVNGRRVPHVSFDACIGCGECQWVCPASPKAIVVEGI